MCTLCRSLTQPEMEYDCENARYNQPGVRAPPGLSLFDQKVWGSLEVSPWLGYLLKSWLFFRSWLYFSSEVLAVPLSY